MATHLRTEGGAIRRAPIDQISCCRPRFDRECGVKDLELLPPAACVEMAIRSWMADYISMPHLELGRTGPICPFVAPAIQVDALTILSCHWPSGAGLEYMIRVITKSVETFESLEWQSDNRALRSLVVVLPELPEDAYWQIDEGHRATKDGIVARGLMLGQFHPKCDAPAARNQSFAVNRSPLPLFAIRYMAFHDVLFLHDRAEWFRHYKNHYERRFQRSERIDAHFTELFKRGCELINHEQETKQPDAQHFSRSDMP